MGKCTIIGKIRVPATVGQAIRINDKKCDEETVWTIPDAYGGESYVSVFTIENKSNVSVPVDFEITPTAPEGEYTAGVFLSDGVTPVTAPVTIDGKTTDTFKLIINFDKYITDDIYELLVEFDYV